MTATPDPSLRFVLADDAPIIANLAALWAHDPKLAAAIEALDATPSYRVEASKSGAPTVSIPTSDGTTIQLHSRYQPLEEAKRLIDPLPLGSCVMYHVHGFGLGYHVEQLFERASIETTICVIENELLLLRTAMELRDFSKLIQSNRLMFFWQADKSALFTRLMSQSAAIAMGFEKVDHAPSLQLAPEFHR